MSERPIFLKLADQGLITAPTLKVLEKRSEAPSQEPRFLAEFETLVALCAVFNPGYSEIDGRQIASQIDRWLASGKGNGWRYDSLPVLAEAFDAGLVALNAEAFSEHGLQFGELDFQQAEAIIHDLRKEKFTPAFWSQIPPQRFLEEVLAQVAMTVYSDPRAQDAIGYVGYADAKGWTRIGLNQREDWES